MVICMLIFKFNMFCKSKFCEALAIFEAASLVRNPLPDCLVRVVTPYYHQRINGMCKKMREESGA